MLTNQSGVSAATLEDLLTCRDDRFIHNAYHLLLGREPDSDGLKYYHARIQSGISKVEILAQLLLSKEGKSRLVRIVGLNEAISRHRLHSIPLIGWLFRLAGEKRVTQEPQLTSASPKHAPFARIGDRYQALVRGETPASKILARKSVRFHLDVPEIDLVNIVKDSCIVSGWAVDLEQHSAVKVRIVVGRDIHHPVSKQRTDVQNEFAHLCELPLKTGFSCALQLPIGVHRMRIEVEAMNGAWVPVRKTILLRIPGKSRVQSRKPRLSYNDWARLELEQLNTAIPDIRLNIEKMTDTPSFTVLVDTRQGSSGLQETLQSIRDQIYRHWDVRVVSSSVSPLPFGNADILKNMSLTDIRGDFIILLQSGQQLSRNALYEFASAVNQHPDIDLVYGDEDSLDARGNRCKPFHKPGWSPDYLETFNYIGFTACFRTSIARGCFENAQLYDLVLQFTERSKKVMHIARILGHNGRKHWFAKRESAITVSGNIAALTDRLRRTGRQGFVSEHPLHKGCYDIRIELRHTPLISIVIPTAGKTVTVGNRRIDLIVNVIRQIRNISSYKNIEIIVVDNGDLSPSQLCFLTDSQCKLITYTNPVFNIAKKLNLGVSIAQGELLLLMNDDIEILTPAWIERLLEHFEKPHVGVVGAKLVYPNQETQHVGVVQPFGNPDHVRRSFARNDAGYFYSTCGVRNFSAVTGAVMMARTDIYREVGGYTDELAVCFNDVDFCMKVGRKKLTVVYTPHAELIHMESLSRVVELDMSELAWFHKRWHPELVSDQFYNDRFLTVEPPTFVPCIN